MEVHRQTCQNCGSHTVHNLLVRQQGEPYSVYVKCAKCGHLVARYRLRAYYHHGKGMDSWLRSIGGDASDSARQQLTDFQRVQEESVEGFARAEEELHRSGRQVGPDPSSEEEKEPPANS